MTVNAIDLDTDFDFDFTDPDAAELPGACSPPSDAGRYALPFFQFGDMDTSWRLLSLCRSYPDLDFFNQHLYNVKILRSVCEECSVRTECLDYAITAREDAGVWGGLTDVERKKLW